jgi:transposase
VLIWPPAVRVFVYTEPTDMRRSFDRLAAMVEQFLGQDPFSGHLFVFVNRRADRMKILFWDRSGFGLFYKRLEQGTFHLPSAPGEPLELNVTRLTLILEGLDLSEAVPQKRYRRKTMKSVTL